MIAGFLVQGVITSLVLIAIAKFFRRFKVRSKAYAFKAGFLIQFITVLLTQAYTWAMMWLGLNVQIPYIYIVMFVAGFGISFFAVTICSEVLKDFEVDDLDTKLIIAGILCLVHSFVWPLLHLGQLF